MPFIIIVVGSTCEQRRFITCRYVAGFLWLDKLGMSALYRHDVVIRQSFYHGCYAMIGEDLLPNPDLWISVLHKRLVGR